MQEGPVSRVEALTDPCQGSKRSINRRLIFSLNGGCKGNPTSGPCFAELDDTGNDIGWSNIEPLDQLSFEVLADPVDPSVILHSRVDGDSITLTVEMRGSCTDEACRAQKAWALQAFGLGPWSRVP